MGIGAVGDSVYIADGVKPRRNLGVNVLISSPRTDGCEEFRKDAPPIHIPEPTEEEVRVLRDVAFPHLKPELTDSVLRDASDIFGRNPRLLFRPQHYKLLKDAVEERLAEEPLRQLVFKRDESSNVGEDIPFRFVHYRFPFDTAAPYRWKPGQLPLRNYMRTTTDWASPYLENRVFNFLNTMHHTSRLRLLSEIFRHAASLPLSLKLWEKWCSVALDRGSSEVRATGRRSGFKIRRLTSTASDSSATLALTPAADGAPAPTTDVGELADSKLGIVKAFDGWYLPAPAAKSISFSTIGDLKKHVAAGGAAHSRRRFVARPGFASIDFWEAQLNHPCGSNASVNPEHSLVVQGETLQNGWRPITAELGLIAADGAKQEPLVHLWLVPASIFGECKHGSLVIASKKRAVSVDTSSSAGGVLAKGSSGGGGSAGEEATGDAVARQTSPTPPSRRSKQKAALAEAEPLGAAANPALATFNAAVEQAHKLAPYIVQYAVVLPYPDEMPA